MTTTYYIVTKSENAKDTTFFVVETSPERALAQYLSHAPPKGFGPRGEVRVYSMPESIWEPHAQRWREDGSVQLRLKRVWGE